MGEALLASGSVRAKAVTQSREARAGTTRVVTGADPVARGDVHLPDGRGELGLDDPGRTRGPAVGAVPRRCGAALRGPARPRRALPASRGARLALRRLHAVRAELKDTYRQLPAATAAGGALAKSELDLRTDLLFGLIEGVILVHRSDPDRLVSAFAEATAGAALRIAGI